jgi:hypothetical protein
LLDTFNAGLPAQLPCATRSCGVLAVPNLYGDCLKGLPLPTVRQEGTGSGSQSSDSGTSLAAAASAAASYQGASDQWVWQVAATNLQHLPDITPALAKCIGLSKLQLACVAAHTLRSGSVVGSWVMGHTVNTWALLTSRAMGFDAEDLEWCCHWQQQQLQQRQQGQQQPFKVVEGLAQLELSSMLLDWAAALDSSEEELGVHSARAALSVHFTLRHFKRQYDRQQQDTVAAQAAVTWQLRRLLSGWADSTLPVLLKAMTKVLHRARSEAQLAAVTGAGAGPASSSTSGSGGNASSGCEGGVLGLLLTALTTCVEVLADLGAATALQTDSGVAPHTGPCFEMSGVWESCGVDVVSVLESYVRLLLSLSSTQLALVDWESTLKGLANVLYPNRQVAAIKRTLGVLLMLAIRFNLPPAARGRKQGPYLHGLMSLLVSTLKLSGSGCVQEEGVGLQYRVAATAACADMLVQSIQDFGAAAAVTSSSSAGGSSSGGVGPQQAGAAGAFTSLLWLVLLGRCCLTVGSC